METLEEMKVSLIILFIAAIIAGCGTSKDSPAEHDLVILNGRLIDPASGVDSILNIGIREGQVSTITGSSIAGAKVIDAKGLVVTAGFVDLHEHGQNDEAYSFMVRDGVTTGLELEVGTADVDGWYAAREGGQYVNYGVSVGHIPVRMRVMEDSGSFLPSGPAGRSEATSIQITQMETLIRKGLDQGALAVGFGLDYTPAATVEEFENMLRIATEYGAVAHIHVEELEDAIAAARHTGAALHIVHANSSGGSQLFEFLKLISDSKSEGLDITTEAYPYGAGSTRIESTMFDDWQEWDSIEFAELQWVKTGERLTRETFLKYRKEGGSVIWHTRTQEMTDSAILNPLVMVASDGSLNDGKGHPRSCGTYALVLSRYVRELEALSLMDALRKMNYDPARRLEKYVPAMKRKGRIDIGADADITVFDLETVKDKATYLNPAQPSEGIRFVLVNGQLVVEDGELVPDSRPGKAVRKNI